MCTAITFSTKDNYFGRTLDWIESYGEKVVVTPRNYPFKFRKCQNIDNHYAIIGMAVISDNYPLYYDGTNEKGLSMAGLNFPDNAHYENEVTDKDNVPPFEFIPWILCQCATVKEVRNKLSNINIIDMPFNQDFKLSPLHWIISDKTESITIEPLKEGIRIYDNSVGVLTNNPTFDMQLLNLNNYMNLSSKEPVNNFSDRLDLKPYSYGMGAIGLPGDLSSMSRFVRAVFTKYNSVSEKSECDSISQFFHIMSQVSQTRGCTVVEGEKYEITLYTSCCNTDKGIYYYTTYGNSQITAIDMHRENIDGSQLISHELVRGQQVLMMRG